jgi:hypothetical protein
MTDFMENNWRFQVESAKWVANSLVYRTFPELAERVKREAEELSDLPPPKDASEMALMVAKSAIMQVSWSNEFLSRAALHASAEMQASTQRAMDALLHRSSAA